MAAQLVSVQVKPGSSKGPMVQAAVDGSLIVYVRERAIDGKANDAVVRLLAGHYGVAKSRISLVRGQSARSKQFRIAD